MKPGKLVTAENEDQAYHKGADWDDDLVLRAKRSEKIAWIIAIVSVVVALPAILRLALLDDQVPVYPVVISVDKATGNMEVMKTPNERAIADYQELVDMHWAKKYVVHREGYFYSMLQYDYDMTLAMSNDQVGTAYAQQFSGDNPLDKKYGDRYELKIRVLSVVLPPDQTGKVVVRFERSLRQRASATVEGTPQIIVATFSYKYEPGVKGVVKQLIENPMGYKVTSYRTDIEMLPSGES